MLRRSSAEASFTRKPAFSSSATRRALTASSWLACIFTMRASWSSFCRWLCSSVTVCRKLSMSPMDWRRIFSSSWLMDCAISSRSCCIFWWWSCFMLSKVSSADSLVSKRLLSSSISFFSFSRSSSPALRSSSFASVARIRMQSAWRWRICMMALWSCRILFTLATFFTAIICCAKDSVLTDSAKLSCSGPMFAINRALALPPRQSCSNMVRAESRWPWDNPMFMLFTTVPREVSTRLIPIACCLLNSSWPSEAACTRLMLSDPARSTKTSLPRRTRGSPGRSACSTRLSMVSVKRQWEREEQQFRVVSMYVQRFRPAFKTSHI
mmetsp:Transcript_46046/g.127932  ORF Transcript_46046/g.127932 Transcript_46046/m.127932 type:complete len:324 (+) Transcript_46046:886-1857(+)